MAIGRFGSTAVEYFIYQQAIDPASGLPDSSVGTRIHKAPVPDDYPFPFITFLRRGANDMAPLGRGQQVTASTLTYEVKAVDQGYDTDRIDEPAGLLDGVLDGQTKTINVDGGWYDITCRRVSELEVELPPEDDGTVYQHKGGIYEFQVCRVY